MGSPLMALAWRLIPHRHLITRPRVPGVSRRCPRCRRRVTRVMGHVVRIGGRR